MAFECNIDARGKVARFQTGLLGVSGGLLLATGTALGLITTTIGMVMAGGSIAGGAFAMWEARMGWCVIRAMGFKTPL